MPLLPGERDGAFGGDVVRPNGVFKPDWAATPMPEPDAAGLRENFGFSGEAAAALSVFDTAGPPNEAVGVGAGADPRPSKVPPGLLKPPKGLAPPAPAVVKGLVSVGGAVMLGFGMENDWVDDMLPKSSLAGKAAVPCPKADAKGLLVAVAVGLPLSSVLMPLPPKKEATGLVSSCCDAVFTGDD